MGQSVVVKKEEKVTNLFKTHGSDITENQFIEFLKKRLSKRLGKNK